MSLMNFTLDQSGSETDSVSDQDTTSSSPDVAAGRRAEKLANFVETIQVKCTGDILARL